MSNRGYTNRAKSGSRALVEHWRQAAEHARFDKHHRRRKAGGAEPARPGARAERPAQAGAPADAAARPEPEEGGEPLDEQPDGEAPRPPGDAPPPGDLFFYRVTP